MFVEPISPLSRQRTFLPLSRESEIVSNAADISTAISLYHLVVESPQHWH